MELSAAHKGALLVTILNALNASLAIPLKEQYVPHATHPVHPASTTGVHVILIHTCSTIDVILAIQGV